MAKKPICPICKRKFTSLEGLGEHMEAKHREMLPKDMSGAQYFYFTRTGKLHGTCVVCESPTQWNSRTNKYSRLCGNPKCKQSLRDQYKKNMIRKYGKITLLNDPRMQREMLAQRSISGEYEFSNGTKIAYVGSYERRFLEFLDKFFQWDPADILSPSPFTYGYEYGGETHFYIPDVYIPSLDLNIEIKDGGDNPNNHPKIKAVDKLKEQQKDSCMMTQPSSYIKIYNNDFGNFILFLMKRKEEYLSGKDVGEPIYLIEDSGKKVTMEAWTSDRRIPDPTMVGRYYASFEDNHPLNYSKTRKYLEKELDRVDTLVDMEQLRKQVELIREDCKRELKSEEGYRKQDAKKILQWLDLSYMPRFERKYEQEKRKADFLRMVTETSSPTVGEVVYSRQTGVHLPEERPKGFFFDYGDTVRWNAIAWIDGKPYREVVETLIFDKDRVFLQIKKNGKIRIPGGSIERDGSLEDQAIAEIHEEAGLEVKNLEGPHLNYIRQIGEGVHDWKLKPQKDTGFPYVGKLSHVYSAFYTGRKFKGKVHPFDIDEDMRKEGEFHLIDEVYEHLHPAHQKVVDWYKEKYEIASLNKESVSSIVEDSSLLLEKLDGERKGKKRLVFLPLFSNNTPFANTIRRVTGQPYSHAGISLDSSMNSIWSFSNIPYVKNMIFNGFVRESIYAPQYVSNIFFDVFAIEVDEDKYRKLVNRIESMRNQGVDKFRYNTVGLIEYYFHKTRAGLIPLEQRTRYFCSEFTAFMLNEAKELPNQNTLISPGDVANIEGVFHIGRYTVATFDHGKLKRDIRDRLQEKRSQATFEAGIPTVRDLYVNIRNRIETIWQEPFLVRYVGVLDWKALRDHYAKLFSKEGVKAYDHFNLIEMIVRAHVRDHSVDAQSRDYTEDFKKTMTHIRDFLNRAKLEYMETKEREIYVRNKKGLVERLHFFIADGDVVFNYISL